MREPSYGPMLAYFEGQADPPGMEEECPSCGVEAGCWCAVFDGARGAGITRRLGFLCARRVGWKPGRRPVHKGKEAL